MKKDHAPINDTVPILTNPDLGKFDKLFFSGSLDADKFFQLHSTDGGELKTVAKKNYFEGMLMSQGIDPKQQKEQHEENMRTQRMKSMISERSQKSQDQHEIETRDIRRKRRRRRARDNYGED